MNCEQRRFHATAFSAFALTCLQSITAPSFAAEDTKSSTLQWRPKDGLYASPGRDFDSRCMESDYFYIDLAEKSIGGNEWSCKVNQLTDTAPGSIRLNMTCDDLNLAEDLKRPDQNPEDMEFKEVMLLKRINDRTISVRKTLDGKFKGPSWQADYCPERAQRAHIELQARNQAEIDRKAAEEQLRRNPWRPKAGVYATAGTDFNDRCLKAGDAIIDFDERSITAGADKCSVTFIRDNPDDIQLFVTCNAPPSSESMVLRKVDDTTIFLKRTKNGNFTDSGTQLSYCGQEAQKIYGQKTKK